MTHLLLQALVVLAAVVIAVRAEPALNRMSRCTPFMVRASFHLLTLPVAGGLLYVEPVYIERANQESSYPQLARVLVFYHFLQNPGFLLQAGFGAVT